MRLVPATCLLLIATQTAPDPWTAQNSGVTARLRGLCVVSDQIAWASGAGGTVLRTVDGGETWELKPVPESDGLDFRDVEAIDRRTAFILSIGSGDLSRIYRTTDGGESWTLRHKNRDPGGFLDALAFWDVDHGLALGDPVDGRFVVLATVDGGDSWTQTAPEGMPEALPGEGAFAASGTCLIVGGTDLAWFATGAGRVFRSTDRGRTWTAHETPIRSDGATSGIFSLAFRDDHHGVAVGGNYESTENSNRVAALTDDGGKTWRLPIGPAPSGYRSAVAYLPGSDPPALVAVGPTGSDRSDDDGATWQPLGPKGFHAVDFADPQAGWAVGEAGALARFTRR